MQGRGKFGSLIHYPRVKTRGYIHIILSGCVQWNSPFHPRFHRGLSSFVSLDQDITQLPRFSLPRFGGGLGWGLITRGYIQSVLFGQFQWNSHSNPRLHWGLSLFHPFRDESNGFFSILTLNNHLPGTDYLAMFDNLHPIQSRAKIRSVDPDVP